MQTVKPVADLTAAERFNFLVTNRIPRAALTRFMGRFSKVENPLVVTAALRIWQWFVDDLRLDEAEKSEFTSLHDCFTRRLKPGARPIDEHPDVIVSPCDAVVGQFGDVNGLDVLQAKGFPYSVAELLGDDAGAERYRDGKFVTLRLKSSMYHRFHAPCAARVDTINYISGDTWNVNPVALKSIERLFCRNERAVMRMQPDDESESITLVAVAAILVASMRLHGLPCPLDIDYQGPNRIPCHLVYEKGAEIGYFEHGSTIVMFAAGNFRFAGTMATGSIIRMGQPLLRRVRNNPDKQE